MMLRHPDHRVSAYRLVDEGWEAVRYEPVALADLRGIRWGPMVSDGERILLVVNGRERTPTEDKRRRMAVVASTADGDHYSTATVPDAWFTDIGTDGETWFAIGTSYAPGQGANGAIWSSTDGATWVERFNSDQAEWTFDSIATGDGHIVVSGRYHQTQAHTTPMVLTSTTGTAWDLIAFRGEEWSPGKLLYLDGRFELHTSVGLGYRSTDGVDWEPFLDEDSPSQAAAVWGDSPGPWGWGLRTTDLRHRGGVVLMSGVSMNRANWLHCYDDLNTCRRAFAAVWLREGGEWLRVELPVPGPIQSEDMGGGARVSGANLVGGTIVLVGLSLVPDAPREEQGYWVWHWVPDDGGSLPPPSPPLDTSPPDSDYVPRPGYYEPLAPGVEYAIPLMAGCWPDGQALGYLNEAFWASDDMSEQVEPDWPAKWIQQPGPDGFAGYMVLGVAILVADGQIEYRIPGIGVVGTFQPVNQWRSCS